MTIIQIGANDGRDHVLEFVSKNVESITKLILIEANPDCIPLLRQTYSGYPFAEIHNFAVVSGDEEFIDLLIPNNDGTSAHASASNDHMAKHGHASPKAVRVPAKSINQVFGEFSNGKVDRFYIDVEGFDIDVINSIDFSNMEIPYLCFEYIHSDGPHSHGGPRLVQCKDRLMNLGYHLHIEGYNIIAEEK